MADIHFATVHTDNPRTALLCGDQRVSYGALARRVQQCAAGLLAGRADLEEARVAFLIPASLDYVTVMHAVWRAGGIAVPLNTGSSTSELEHYLGSAQVSQLVVEAGQHSAELATLCAALEIPVTSVDALLDAPETALPQLDPTRRAMLVFTSGTTSKPKGVVTTHHTIRTQIETLVDAWRWHPDDVIPLFLPLHHVHGIINVLSCALWTGAAVELFPRFDAASVTARAGDNAYSLFMAVPTIYVKLIEYLDSLDASARGAIVEGFRAMRLNVSGSAACPVSVFERWQSLTGQALLERYGMTEIGMALANPYDGERRAGYVGQPLPGVHIRLVDDSGAVIGSGEGAGEIHVRGANVFLEYWNNPRATAEAFDGDWFRTGDIAVVEDGYYRIMGRSSVDIIKSGGFKLSALEIESALLNHPAIAEVAVVGIADDVWGEAVAAAVVAAPGASLDFAALRAWCGERLSSYKIPKLLKLVDALPRNAMGKVTKPPVKALFAGDEDP